jgi:hypothetical protein
MACWYGMRRAKDMGRAMNLKHSIGAKEYETVFRELFWLYYGGEVSQ